MVNERVNNLVVVTGRKGCGKTCFAARLVRRYAAGRCRVVAVSPVGSFRDERGRSPLPGAPVVRSAKETAWALLAGQSVLVLPEDDQAALFAFRFAWHVADLNKPVVLAVDEIDLYLSKYRADPVLQKIVRYGRHRCLSLIGIAQRPANIHNDLLAMADRVVMFATRLPGDVEVLARYTGVPAERLSGLQRFEFLDVDLT